MKLIFSLFDVFRSSICSFQGAVYNNPFARDIIEGNSGSHLLFHTVSSIVPSAAYVFTVVFGMGTGVARKRIATGNFFLLPREALASFGN